MGTGEDPAVSGGTEGAGREADKEELEELNMGDPMTATPPILFAVDCRIPGP